ncbi:cell wall hydrolase [Salipiger pacificus]|nr:cell wall hydrolase [Alloyangia pacifica]
MPIITAAATCLALTMYHEARGEGVDGMLAVADVVLNRKADPRWPSTVCDVVFDPDQFEWTIDDILDEPTEPEAWSLAERLAVEVLADPHATLIGYEATHFHAVDKTPYWAPDLDLIGKIGGHVFYAEGTIQ